MAAVSAFFKGKSKKTPADAPKTWLEPPNVDAKLGDFKWKSLVATPQGIPEGEWIASHTGQFYRNISVVYASLADFCTNSNCPAMTAGSKTEFVWADDKGKKLKNLSAPQYIDYCFSHIQSALDDEATFPTRVDMALPKDFIATNRRLYRLLFNVFAHIYWHHYNVLLQLGEVPHTNTLFTHFVYFTSEHGLLDPKDTACMADLMKHVTAAPT